jgi:hypothetical protein
MARTFEEIKAKASRPATVVSLCLDGAALGEIRALERQLAEAPLPTNLGERNPATVIAEQIQAVQARVAESMVDFHLRAVRGVDWVPFWETRPTPAEGESAEEFNARWFPFVCQIVSLTCVDPVMTPEQVVELVDDLPMDSWLELSEAAWALNTNKVSVPFSAAVSALSQISGETSRRPSESGSRSPSSAARKPAKKPRTTAKTAKSPATP